MSSRVSRVAGGALAIGMIATAALTSAPIAAAKPTSASIAAAKPTSASITGCTLTSGGVTSKDLSIHVTFDNPVHVFWNKSGGDYSWLVINHKYDIGFPLAYQYDLDTYTYNDVTSHPFTGTFEFFAIDHSQTGPRGAQPKCTLTVNWD
jgi:hypothetical protein